MNSGKPCSVRLTEGLGLSVLAHRLGLSAVLDLQMSYGRIDFILRMCPGFQYRSENSKLKHLLPPKQQLRILALKEL